MNEYCSLEQLRNYITSSAVTMTREDDARLTQYAFQASRILDGHCRRRFYPEVKTNYYDYQRAYRILLDEDLLEISSLTAAGELINSNVYWGYPLNSTPKWKIELDHSQGQIMTYSGTRQRAIEVAGTWGWHDNWAYAFLDSADTTEDDPLTSSATTVTVNAAEGADSYGYAPRFSIGQMLKVETEYLAVVGINWTDETLTVLRGVNGTTAAEHAQNTPIYVYQPPGEVNAATLAAAKFIYETRSATGGVIALPSLEGAALRASIISVLENFELSVRPDDLKVFA